MSARKVTGIRDDRDMTFRHVMKQPSAFLPIGMSLVAIALLLAHIVLLGTVRQADEGTAAHLFQLLMAAQVPIIAWFAVKWLPRARVRALQVLGLQIAAALTAFAPVYFLKW